MSTLDEQVAFYNSNIKGMSKLTESFKVYLEKLIGKKCTISGCSYNAINFIGDSYSYDIQLSLVRIISTPSKGLKSVLVLRTIYLEDKNRHHGTKITKYLVKTAKKYKYDGLELESICSDAMLKIAVNLKFKKSSIDLTPGNNGTYDLLF